MSSAIRLVPDPARELAFGSIAAGYMGIGTSFTKPVRILILQNMTDANLWISFDGVDDHIPIVAGGYMIIDVTANKTVDSGFFIAEGTRMYVKRIGVPTSGSMYVSSFYGAD